MDVTPLIKEGQQIIQSYAGGRFRVSGQVFEHAVIVTPSHTTEWYYVKSNEGGEVVSPLEWGEDMFAPLVGMARELDVVLLGTGQTQKFLPPALKNALKDKGLSIDVMDTGAACRTYNVLMADGRRVAAALLPV